MKERHQRPGRQIETKTKTRNRNERRRRETEDERIGTRYRILILTRPEMKEER